MEFKLKTILYDGLDIIKIYIDAEGNYKIERTKKRPEPEYSLDYSNGTIKHRKIGV